MAEQRFCKRCDDFMPITVGCGTTVHAGRLVCSECGLFLTWIKKTQAMHYDIPEAPDKVEICQPKQKELF